MFFLLTNNGWLDYLMEEKNIHNRKFKICILAKLKNVPDLYQEKYEAVMIQKRQIIG